MIIRNDEKNFEIDIAWCREHYPALYLNMPEGTRNGLEGNSFDYLEEANQWAWQASLYLRRLSKTVFYKKVIEYREQLQHALSQEAERELALSVKLRGTLLAELEAELAQLRARVAARGQTVVVSAALVAEPVAALQQSVTTGPVSLVKAKASKTAGTKTSKA